MKIALLQLTSGDDPAANLVDLERLVADASTAGAELIATPEVTNCVSASRSRQNDVLQLEEDDQTLSATQIMAKQHSVWIALGSLAVKTNDADGRFANRSFMVSPTGDVAARYDKIHMFDVEVSEAETYHESAGYRPGERAVIADVDGTAFGLTICYDLRFPHLFRALAQAGAQIIMVPSAFSPVTGAAHWETLLRARAIETGCYIVAAAQTGLHQTTTTKQRKTYGHSMVISPWGEIIADAGTRPGVTLVDLDLSEVAKSRRRVPSLSHDRRFEGP